MSNQRTDSQADVQAQAALAEQLQAARAYIFQTVEAPFWLAKMAELGFPAEDEQTAQNMIAIGLRVASLPDNDPVLHLGAEVLRQKTAQISSPMANFLKTAHESLDLREHFAQAAAAAQQPPPAQIAPLVKAAEHLQFDENLKNAALFLRTAAELAALQNPPSS